MALSGREREVDGGIASVDRGPATRAVAPFFRVPGLLRTEAVENYLASKSIAVWSADEVADDWFSKSAPRTVVRQGHEPDRGQGHSGILLLHDIHPATDGAADAAART